MDIRIRPIRRRRGYPRSERQRLVKRAQARVPGRRVERSRTTIPLGRSTTSWAFPPGSLPPERLRPTVRPIADSSRRSMGRTCRISSSARWMGCARPQGGWVRNAMRDSVPSASSRTSSRRSTGCSRRRSVSSSPRRDPRAPARGSSSRQATIPRSRTARPGTPARRPTPRHRAPLRNLDRTSPRDSDPRTILR